MGILTAVILFCSVNTGKDVDVILSRRNYCVSSVMICVNDVESKNRQGANLRGRWMKPISEMDVVNCFRQMIPTKY